MNRIEVAARFDLGQILGLPIAPPWCSVVHNAGGVMATKAKKPSKLRAGPRMPRASVSFPDELYTTLESIAKQKKVSVAWVVREAAENYVSDQWPLFAKKGRGT